MDNMFKTHLSLLEIVKEKDFINNTIDESVNKALTQALTQTNQNYSIFNFICNNYVSILGYGMLTLACIYGYNYLIFPYTTIGQLTAISNRYMSRDEDMIIGHINTFGQATTSQMNSIYTQLDLINSETATLRETHKLTKVLVEKLIDSDTINTVSIEIAKNSTVIESVGSTIPSL
jgi:hypothetical protein